MKLFEFDIDYNLRDLGIAAITSDDDADDKAYRVARAQFNALWTMLVSDVARGRIDALHHKLQNGFDVVIVRSPRGGWVERHVLDGDIPVSTVHIAHKYDVIGKADEDGVTIEGYRLKEV